MVQTGVRITEEMYEEIDSIAMGRSISKQEVIRRAIAYYIENNQPALTVGRGMKEARKDIIAGGE